MDEHALQQLVERFAPGGRLLHAAGLHGGVSAQTAAIDVEYANGERRQFVVRRHGEIDRAANPRIARDEFHLLEIVLQHGLAVPAPVYLDESCVLFPTPLLVIELIDGTPDAAPSERNTYAGQAARELARIHTIRDSPQLSFLPRQARTIGQRTTPLDRSLGEGRIRSALESAQPVQQVNGNVLLHGDYWPGNLLWSEGQLVGVVDWEDARVGDPLSDLSNARMEIAIARGRRTMEAFTAHYLSLTDIDVSALAWWDLRAALRPCGKMADWGLSKREQARFRRRHGRFVKRAIRRMPGR